MKKWADSESHVGWGLEDRVQALDEIVSGLWALSEPGGKYGRIVRRFEKWMGGVQEVHDMRKKGLLSEGDEVVFVEELERAWRDELRAQARKVENLKDKLGDLGEVEGRSSLATVVDSCRALTRGMMMELTVMKKTEAEVMKAERDWIRDMINDVDVEEPGTSAGAVWRRM